MKDMIEQFINENFKNSDSDFREELISNYTEKYEALLKNNTPEDAYNKVIIDLQSIIVSDQNNTLGTRKKIPQMFQYYWPITIVILFILSFIFGYEYTGFVFVIAWIIYYLLFADNKKIAFRNIIIGIPAFFVLRFVMNYSIQSIGFIFTVTCTYLIIIGILYKLNSLYFFYSYYLTVLYAYLIISYIFNIWEYSFVIFIIAPFIYQLLLKKIYNK